jgi:hypothetical protein
VNPPQDELGLWAGFTGETQGILGFVDHRGDGGCHHDIRLRLFDNLFERIIGDVICHSVNKAGIVVASLLECATEVGCPARGPIPGNFCSTSVVVWLYHQDTHKKISSIHICVIATTGILPCGGSPANSNTGFLRQPSLMEKTIHLYQLPLYRIFIFK